MQNSEALAKYREALDELLFACEPLGRLVRAMGQPLWDENFPTAYVTYTEDEPRRIAFAFNPDFMLRITMEEAAGVLAHEAYHVALSHLLEGMDTATYPQREALIKAQECIINDTLVDHMQMELPGGVFRGPDLINLDCAPLSTLEAYRKFLEEEQTGESESEDDAGGESQSNAGDGGGGAPTRAAGEDKPADGDAGKGQPGADESKGAGGESGDAQPGDGSNCGGIRVPEGLEAEAKGAAKKLVENASDSMNVTPEEFEEELVGAGGGGYTPDGKMVGDTTAALSSARMNWRELLARINPKILEAGTRTRYTNNWTKPNRRLSSVYPRVILPVSQRVEPKAKDRGDTLPVLVIALDLSGSIPRALVKMLQGMLQDVPPDLIKAFPCTWSDVLVPYDPDRPRVCYSGGTKISLVTSYVDKLKKEQGIDPYVLVITDGQFSYYGEFSKKWLFMAVQDRDVNTCKTHTKGDPSRVYRISDFRVEL